MKKLVVLNHKMSMLYDEVYTYIDRLNSIDTDNDIIICPSSIYLEAFVNNSEWAIGAQNMHYSTDDMHTGEISSDQLKSLDVHYTLVGHYERVSEFKENASIVNQKLLAALDSNIFPIFFFGENIDDDYKEVLPKMLDSYLRDIDNIECIMFVYEPIYAIGTGALPSAMKIKEVSEFIIDYLGNKYGRKPVLLYGGSVDSSNVKEITDIDSLSGVVVGNISSDIKEVERIFNCI